MGKIGRIPNDPTILYMILPFLGSLYDPKRFCNIPSVKKKKKKKEMIRLFWFPRAPHLTPLPTSFLSFGWLSLFFLSFSFFALYLHTHFHTHPPTSTLNHTISPSFFRQDHRKKYLGTPKHLHHFI